MQQVLTELIWDGIAAKANGKKKSVAVAYVTDLGELKFRKGDVLVCDASDGNVTAGAVDRKLLKRLCGLGVNVISKS